MQLEKNPDARVIYDNFSAPKHGKEYCDEVIGNLNRVFENAAARSLAGHACHTDDQLTSMCVEEDALQRQPLPGR